MAERPKPLRLALYEFRTALTRICREWDPPIIEVMKDGEVIGVFVRAKEARAAGLLPKEGE